MFPLKYSGIIQDVIRQKKAQNQSLQLSPQGNLLAVNVFSTAATPPLFRYYEGKHVSGSASSQRVLNYSR